MAVPRRVLFAAGVPVGWVILVRRERRDRAEAAAKEAEAAAEPAETEGAEDAGEPVARTAATVD